MLTLLICLHRKHDSFIRNSVQLLSVLVAVIMWLCASDVAEARPLQGKL